MINFGEVEHSSGTCISVLSEQGLTVRHDGMCYEGQSC